MGELFLIFYFYDSHVNKKINKSVFCTLFEFQRTHPSSPNELIRRYERDHGSTSEKSKGLNRAYPSCQLPSSHLLLSSHEPIANEGER